MSPTQHVQAFQLKWQKSCMEQLVNHCILTLMLSSLIKVEVRLRLLHIGPVALLEVLLEDDIPVLADSMHPSFLTYSSNLKGH